MIAPVVSMTDEELINELAREIAEATFAEDVDDEAEAALDALFAEYEARMYAAHSYDLDAEAYGNM